MMIHLQSKEIKTDIDPGGDNLESVHREFGDYITYLCEPIDSLLEQALEIKEINKNKKLIRFWIREIVCEIYRLGIDLSPRLVLASAMYFSTSLKPKVIIVICKITRSSLFKFLELIKIKKEIKEDLVIYMNKIRFLTIIGKTIGEISHITEYSEEIIDRYIGENSYYFITFKKCNLNLNDIYAMIFLKRKYFSNKIIGAKFKINQHLVERLLRTFMPDYEKYKRFHNTKVDRFVLNKMISLKKQYLTNREVGKKLILSESTVSKYLREYFSEYDLYNVGRSSKKEVKLLKFRQYQNNLKSSFGDKKLTGKMVCNICLYEPALRLLNGYLDISEIKKNEDKIKSLIREICSRLFQINRSRLPKHILAAAVYLCMEHRTLPEVSRLLELPFSPTYDLLKLVQLGKVKKSY